MLMRSQQSRWHDARRRIAWLADSFIAELLVHGKPSEVSATALDALLAVELEAVAVEERSCGKTGKSGNPRGANRVQRGLDAMVKAACDTATSERRMSEEKVEVAVERIRSEACEDAVRLGDDGMKVSQAILPACGIRWDWCPRGNLLWRIVGRCQRANRSGISLDHAWQVGGLVWSFVHRSAQNRLTYDYAVSFRHIQRISQQKPQVCEIARKLGIPLSSAHRVSKRLKG